jgi:hypothetical protein
MTKLLVLYSFAKVSSCPCRIRKSTSLPLFVLPVINLAAASLELAENDIFSLRPLSAENLKAISAIHTQMLKRPLVIEKERINFD